MLLVLQGICSFLFAVGSLFILIDFRTSFDKSFRFFGVSLLILCCMTGIDLWVTPGLTNVNTILYWQRFYHLLACLFIPFSIWYLLILTASPYLKFMPFFAAASFLLATFFLTNKMLFIDNGTYRGGILYSFLFLPFVAIYIITSNYVIINKLIHSQPNERKILIFHLVGFLGLFFCGIIDLADVTNVYISKLPSFSILGALGYGLMASMIFIERFLVLITEKENNFKKLETAYLDLEQVNALKQLGESTAIINHEIKNYMFMISGNAQMLNEFENLSPKGKDLVNNITNSVARLTYFSDDILKLSRTQIVKELHPVNLTEIIKGTIESHFFDRKKNFVLRNFNHDQFLFGDWGKLEQVFVNLFKNSFEACRLVTPEITVKLSSNQSVIVVSVEDNGVGCTQEQFDGLFKAFYTTKKSFGGTGLGMSISRTIVEGHGGKISAYLKDSDKLKSSRLKLILSFPTFADKDSELNEKKSPIVIIKDGVENLQDIIRIFQNLRITPYIFQDIIELNDANFAKDSISILVSAKTMSDSFKKLSKYPKLCLVSNHDRNLYILDHGKLNKPEIFSEEYVLNNLVKIKTQRSRYRIREREYNPSP